MRISPLVSRDDSFENFLNKEEKSLHRNWEDLVDQGRLLHEEDLAEKVKGER